MKPAICLFIALLSGCAATPPQTASSSNVGDVIELPEVATHSGPKRFGFECGVLLRDDFTRFHDGECQRQLAGRTVVSQQPRELTVRDLTQTQ